MIVAIATKETADFWAEKVRGMSVHTLQIYVREFKKADLQAKINGDFRDVPKCLHPQDLFFEINLRVDLYLPLNCAQAGFKLCAKIAL